MRLVLTGLLLCNWPVVIAALRWAPRWAELAVRWRSSINPDAGLYRYTAFLCSRREFRSVVYYRMRVAGPISDIASRLLAAVYRPQETLLIDCPSIGPGLYIEHGIATVINAERIGANCWINQQVTVGYGAYGDRPIIGNDVKIRAGAIVVGGVHLGDGCQVNAGAVVVKDVPSGVNVAGVPAAIVTPRPK
jgi:serine O-acetyltransferase